MRCREKGREMRAAVWYRREPIFFRTDDSLTMEKLPETHIQVCIIEDARSKEEVFGQMQEKSGARKEKQEA